MPHNAVQKPKQLNPVKDLILLFAIPTTIVVFAALVIYLPTLLANPKSDFIYTLCDEYTCRDTYSVTGSGQIIKTDSKSVSDDYYDKAATLRYYDANDDSTREMTLDEAQAHTLSRSSKSPDGYSLVRGGSGGGFLFWGDSNSGWYLENGPKKKEVELSTNGSYYSDNIKLLGWVGNER